MTDIAKVSGIEIASVASVAGIEAAKIMGLTWPAGAPTVSGRYVRVNFSTNWGAGNWVNMEAIEIYNGVTMLNNADMTHSQGGTVIANPNRCSDNSATDWPSSATELPNWWKVDLGSAMEMTKILLKGSGDSTYVIKDFTVNISNDDSAYSTILSAQTVQNLNAQEFLF